MKPEQITGLHLTAIESTSLRNAAVDQWETYIDLYENGEPPTHGDRCPGIHIYANSKSQAITIRRMLMSAMHALYQERQVTYNLPPLPEADALGMDFDKGWDGVRAYGHTDEAMHEYGRACERAAYERFTVAGSFKPQKGTDYLEHWDDDYPGTFKLYKLEDLSDDA